MLVKSCINDAIRSEKEEVKVTHEAMKYLYYGKLRLRHLRSPAWNCSKSTAVLKVGSNAGGTTPQR
ncbi:hypothetical protein BME18_21000 [Klebsiella michiganensis]|nr:hypothetical protein BWI76_19665 [Klebsiella sp. M5al]OVU32122.1 hypothetical protein BME18_21000 [Klebsiella michiganensis]